MTTSDDQIRAHGYLVLMIQYRQNRTQTHYSHQRNLSELAISLQSDQRLFYVVDDNDRVQATMITFGESSATIPDLPLGRLVSEHTVAQSMIDLYPTSAVFLQARPDDTMETSLETHDTTASVFEYRDGDVEQVY